MERVLFLVHKTNIKENDPKWSNIRIRDNFPVHRLFPGAYFSLVTKDNYETETKRLFASGKDILIFSPDLLKQRNYHFNPSDHNGIISERTFFPWNIEKAIKQLPQLDKFYHGLVSWTAPDKKVGNEVVFHDSVPMKYMLARISKTKEQNNNKSYINKVLNRLPKSTVAPDMTKLPFFNNGNLTDKKFKGFVEGIYPNKNKKISSESFRTVMEKVKNGFDYETLRKKRHLQNFEALMLYTCRKNKVNKNKNISNKLPKKARSPSGSTKTKNISIKNVKKQ